MKLFVFVETSGEGPVHVFREKNDAEHARMEEEREYHDSRHIIEAKFSGSSVPKKGQKLYVLAGYDHDCCKSILGIYPTEEKAIEAKSKGKAKSTDEEIRALDIEIE